VDDFSFAPFFGDPDYGFTVTVNSGAKAITATSTGYAIAGASLLFTVATTDGNRSIYSVSASGPSLGVTGLNAFATSQMGTGPPEELAAA